MTFPLIVGAKTSTLAELRQELPLNLQVQIMDAGAVKMYLAPIEGVVDFLTLTKTFRGYFVWRNALFVVAGPTVYIYNDVDAALRSIGTISNDGNAVQFAAWYEQLAILTAGAVYYVTQGADYSILAPTDPSLAAGNTGVAQIGGYFILTDGAYLYNTTLSDPNTVTASDSLQIQSDTSEILGMLTVRSELYVILRNSIQMLQNVNATGFPFSVVASAMIGKGAVNAHAFAYFQDFIMFVGGAANESVSVYAYSQGALQRMATQEMDAVLSALTKDQLAALTIDTFVSGSNANFIIHAGGHTYVFNYNGSQVAGVPLWHERSDARFEGDTAEYSCRNFLRYAGKSLCVQGSKIKELQRVPYTNPDGARPIWRFSTPIIYDKSIGMIVHREELVALPGRDPDNTLEGQIALSSSQDGLTWSTPQIVNTGRIGDTLKNLVWFRRGIARNWRIEKFVGLNAPYLSMLLLEMDIEELAQ